VSNQDFTPTVTKASVRTLAEWGQIKYDRALAEAEERVVEKTMPLRTIPEVDYATAERKMQWAGPFPVRRVESMTGRLSIKKPELPDVPRDPEGRTRVTLEKFVKEATVEELVEAVVALSDEEGVEREAPNLSSSEHRIAAKIQELKGPMGYFIWYGEATREYWVMDESGLRSFETIAALYQGMGWEVL
jgi:hypothetical protein